ncbi:zf-HC2 domain-containing protein [Streptomyces sp. DSM 41527]|uniref:Zf-HC2 domain-containing protein n=1 Tax=Streptomyces mooreae TaxID=3075523 RepID=A0ABU2T343_9ACTN|nr:zf-HC2 domain-containing protein [Streptomyces sp. DSM 41527]MDT0455648.1 zf-HC2 domain-containing protein [Streptomyces sp. DSM 41527]
MTGTDEHPTGEHPEVSELSDLTDGLLSPSRSADVRHHLAGCPLCDDVYASLEEIRALLGTLPGPTRMPADVAGRIDAALAAEALLDASTPSAAAHVSRETATTPVVVSRETDTEPPHRGGPSTRPAGRPRGSSGPGRQSPGGRSPRSRRWPRILLSTAAAAAVFSFGGLLIQNAAVDGSQAGHHGRATVAPEKTTEAAGLTAATLGSHVHDLLASKGSHKSPDIGTRTSPESTLRGGADTVPSCVRLGTGRTEAPLASSHTRYQGKDAYLVVLPDPADAQRVSAFVVSSSCVSATPPAPGKILLSHSYQRD